VGVQLVVLEGVFSSAGVDAGTKHLLRWLATDRFASASSVLDVGCGYGPLGLWLAAARPDRQVTAVDRDARAVEATLAGAAANGLADRVHVAGSLGYDDVDTSTFDLVVSNVPAKVGPAALSHLLLDARPHVGAEGLVAVVVVDRLAGAVAAVLADPAVDVVERHPSRAYTAFVYRFTADPAGAGVGGGGGFDRGVYRRGRAGFRAAAASWEADVSFDLPEYDTLSHGTLAAVELLAGERGEGVPGSDITVVAGTGQGHLPLALRAQPRARDLPLRLVDRDLLALRTAEANLLAVGGPPPAIAHAGRLRAEHLDGAVLAVVALPEREPVAVTAAVLGAALRELAAPPTLVVHGRTSDVQRVLELLARDGARADVIDRRRHAGHSAARATISVTPPR
jgi:SAM-dependent methyltransferase